MPVNEFEKKVQQRMEELKLTPSAEVWPAVEKRIRKEKKRRRILFWWLIPGLLLGGGLLYYDTGKKQIKSQVIRDTSAGNTKPAGQEKAASPAKIVDDRATTKQQPVVEANGKDGSRKADSTTPPAVSPVATGKTFAQQSATYTEVNTVRNSQAERKSNKLVSTESNNKAEPVNDSKAIKGNLQTDSTHEAVIITGKPPAPARDVTASTSDSIAAATPFAKDSIPSETTEVKSPVYPQAKKKKKWNYGFGIQAGTSNTRTGGIFGAGMASYDASPLTNTGSGGTYTGPPVYIDAPRKGGSWGLQGIAEKDISPRLGLRVTLQYDYFSTRMKTGNRVDSSTRVNNSISDNLTIHSFYTPPASGGLVRTYTNRYHLAGLSLTLSWKLMTTGKFRPAWENSIGLSRLLSTNALHYDRNQQVYYQDFDPFRKTQFYFSSGIAIPVTNNEKFRLSIHPFIQYAPGKLLKENNGPRSHFVNYGAGIQFLLPQRK